MNISEWMNKNKFLCKIGKSILMVLSASFKFVLIVLGWFAIVDFLVPYLNDTYANILSSKLFDGLAILVAALYALFPPYTTPTEEDIKVETFPVGRKVYKIHANEKK